MAAVGANEYEFTYREHDDALTIDQIVVNGGAEQPLKIPAGFWFLDAVADLPRRVDPDDSSCETVPLWAVALSTGHAHWSAACMTASEKCMGKQHWPPYTSHRSGARRPP